MSSGSFSNTNVPADKHADPYREKNLDTDASVETKVHDVISFAKSQKFGLMATVSKPSGMIISRCMAIAGIEDGIDLIFHTNTESHKTDELEADPHVNIGFLNDSSGDWASFSGEAQIITDRETVKKHYSSQLKAWVGDLGDGKHDGSANDPRIGVIRVNTKTVTYAISDKSAVTRAMEIAKGTVTGNAASVHKLRELTQQDVAMWRQSKALVS